MLQRLPLRNLRPTVPIQKYSEVCPMSNRTKQSVYYTSKWDEKLQTKHNDEKKKDKEAKKTKAQIRIPNKQIETKYVQLTIL